jgi:hypothetical protein
MKTSIQFLTLIVLLLLPLSGSALSGADAFEMPRQAGERILSGNALGGAFYENRGQIADETGRVVDDIKYYAFYRGARVYFTPTGWHIVYSVIDDAVEEEHVSEATGIAAADMLPPDEFAEEMHHLPAMQRYLMSVTLVGMRPDVEIEATGLQSRYLNYYLAHCPDGITRVAAWSGLRYRNVYDNIDLVLYAAREGLKYEFVVHPGGNVADIRMCHEGYDAFESVADGSLRLHWAHGYTHEGAPFSYQDFPTGLRALRSSYRVAGDQVQFDVDAYDASRPLVIDPFSTYYGGSSFAKLRGLTCDSANAVIASGFTNAYDFPVYSAFQSTNPTVRDPKHSSSTYAGFVLKINAERALQWATYIGGSKIDYVGGVAVDADDNIVFVGYTGSPDFPVHDGFQMIKPDDSGAGSGFIFKLDSGGSRIWASFVHDTTYYSNGSLYDVAIDADGNIYAVGIGRVDYPIPLLGPQQPFPAGSTDIYFLKMTPDGSLLLSSYLGGSHSDSRPGIAVDSRGNFGIIFQTRSDDIPILNAFMASKPSKGQLTAYFVAMYDSIGRQRWSTYLGGSGFNDSVNPIPGKVFNNKGDLIVGDGSSSKDFPVVNSPPPAATGGSNSFLTRFNDAGQALWSSIIGGPTPDGVVGLVSDSIGNLYVAGGVRDGTTFPLLYPAYPDKPNQPASVDGYIRKYDSTNTLRWSTLFGGQDTDHARAVAIDRRGALYVAGETWGQDFPLYNPLQTTNRGRENIFIHRFYTDGTIPVTLSRLAAQRVHGGVRLDWRSESEVNAHGYIIERRHEHSAGGESRWSDVGFVPAAAQGGEGRDYTWLDSNAPGGEARIFYRLRMLDNDGSFEHSPAVEVAPEHIASIVSFEAVWPAPANDWLTLRFALPVEQAVTLIVHDLSGREVARIHDNQLLGPGMHSIVIPVSSWRSGAYLCTLSAGEAHIIRRVMIMR